MRARSAAIWAAVSSAADVGGAVGTRGGAGAVVDAAGAGVVAAGAVGEGMGVVVGADDAAGTAGVDDAAGGASRSSSAVDFGGSLGSAEATQVCPMAASRRLAATRNR